MCVMGVFSILIVKIESKSDNIKTNLDRVAASYSSNNSTTIRVEKMRLNIAIMLPTDYMNDRVINTCIKREMNIINRGNWTFTKHFYLERYKLKSFTKV